MKRATNGEIILSVTGVISIHALVKRATKVTYVLVAVGCISIHALVKRATGARLG
mgnify:CR=1 FL=1